MSARIQVAALLFSLLLISTGWGQEMSGGWDHRVNELDRAIRDLNCFDVIDEGQYLNFRYFTDADVEACAQGKVEEVLERNRKFVDHLECKMLLEFKSGAEFRRDGAVGLENAIAEVANPVPDSISDFFRKLGKGLDGSTVVAAWIDSHERNKMATDFDLIAARIRMQALQFDAILKQQQEKWTAHMANDPNCPPPDDPAPPPEPEPEIEKPVKPKPAPPKPKPNLTGHVVFSCQMDMVDKTLGYLSFCTEYDSVRLGQQPTAQMIEMSESICLEANGAWSATSCRADWKKRCLSRKGAAHYYYSFVEDAPELQCERWQGTLETREGG